MKKLVFLFAGCLSFSAFTQMTTVGTATQFGGCDCYQLIPAVNASAGAIWSPQTIDMNNNFDMTFNVFLGSGGIWAADGIAFVLQENPSGIGSVGNKLGYGAPYGGNPISPNSLAIELDVFDNGGSVPTDPSNDHMGMSSGGIVDHNVVPATTFPGLQEISDGAYHQFRVQWNAAFNVLSVYWEGSATPMIFLNSDIPNTIFGGNQNLYWGFTAASGGLNAEMRVCNVSTSSFTTDLTSVCPGLPIQFTDGSVANTGINGWSWDFGDASALNTTQNPSYAYSAPGSYTAELTMTDGFGCDYVSTAVITVLDSIALTMSANDVTCFGDTDGTGSSVPTNGVSPYTYTWDDPSTQTTQAVSGLAPGTYTVNVVDNLGCVGIETIIIGEPNEFLVDLSGNDVICFSDSTGDATVTTIDGVSPFTFLWDDYAAQTTSTASNLPAGTYMLTATDNNGCIATGTIDLFEGNEIIVTGVASDDNGTSNGAIDLTVSGGLAPYIFSWDNAAITEDISGLAAGFYTVTVTDDNGCPKVVTFEVKSSAGLGSLSEIGFSIYPNPSNGEFTINGFDDYEIAIHDLSGKVIYSAKVNNTAEIDLNNLSDGLYMLRIIKDGNSYLSKLILN